MLEFLASPQQLYPALWIRGFQVLQRTCCLSWKRNHCLPHVFSKQCECFTKNKFFLWKGGGEKDWAVWCCGLIFYFCLCMLGEQSDDNIRLWVFVCVRLISRQRILINKGEALAHFSEYLWYSRWGGIVTGFLAFVQRGNWSGWGKLAAGQEGLALKSAGGCWEIKWRSGKTRLGITWRKPGTLFLFSILRLGGRKFILHEATPDISLLQQRCKLLKRSLERVTDLSSDSAGWMGKQNCSPGGTLLRPDKVWGCLGEICLLIGKENLCSGMTWARIWGLKGRTEWISVVMMTRTVFGRNLAFGCWNTKSGSLDFLLVKIQQTFILLVKDSRYFEGGFCRWESGLYSCWGAARLNLCCVSYSS